MTYVPADIPPESSRKRSLPIKAIVPAAAIIVVASVVISLWAMGIIGGGEGKVDLEEEQPESSIHGGFEPVLARVEPEPEAPQPYSIIDYDNKGRKNKETFFDQDDSITGWHEYEHHDNGNVSQIAEFDADGNILRCLTNREDGSLLHLWEISYDKNGNRSLSVRFNEFGIMEISHLLGYGAAGELIERIDSWYDENGDISRYIVNELFENGETRFASFFEANDKATFMTETREFDDIGRLVMSTAFIEDGTQESRIEYEYDEDTDFLLYIHEYDDSDMKTHLTAFEYDEDGLAVQRRISELNSSGQTIRTRVYHKDSADEWEYLRTETPTGGTTGGISGPTTQQTTCQEPSLHGVYSDYPPVQVHDSSGRLTRETWYYRCGCTYSWIFEYAEDGTLLRSIRRNNF